MILNAKLYTEAIKDIKFYKYFHLTTILLEKNLATFRSNFCNRVLLCIAIIEAQQSTWLRIITVDESKNLNS